MRCIRQNRRDKTGRGFTLIELLIVTGLVAVISLTIYSSLSNGIEIWQRLNTVMPEENINLFFEKFTLDLRNCVKFSAIDFTGEKDRFEFCSIVKGKNLQKTTLGKVIYGYNKAKGIVERKQLDFSQLYNEEAGKPIGQIANIKALKLSYFAFDKINNVYAWEEEWSKKEPPLAVKIELDFKYDPEKNGFTRSVSIPISW